MTDSDHRFWAVVPAAGLGRRMGLSQPKQFLSVAGRSLLAHSLERLASVPGLAGIVLVVRAPGQPGDWGLSDVSLVEVEGGAERSDSVLAGLEWLVAHQGAGTWALVHDAARPGVRVTDVETLMQYCRTHNHGAILGLPSRDTVKQADDTGHAVTTLDRERIWLAQTPQCFRAGPLQQALVAGREQALNVTDEASAMEAQGHPVGLVRGHWRNAKLTDPEDLDLIEWILTHND